MTSNRHGFTLVELLMAMVLFSIVGTAIYQLLVNNQRLYREQTARIELNQTVRAAAAVLPGDLRELNADDPAGSDILNMQADQLTYKAMRSLYVLCQPPDLAGLQVTLSAASFFGLRMLDASQDSLLLFAEGDPTTRTDDQWLHADVTFIQTGNACPNGQASVRATLAGLAAIQLAMVEDGAPVRGFEVARVQLYDDGTGDFWLGARRYRKAMGNWTAIVPVTGPLSSTGVAFTYLDANGNATAVPTDVRRIGITVAGTSDQQFRGSYLSGDLVTSVALRNNPTY